MFAQVFPIVSATHCFGHPDACQVFNVALEAPEAQTVVIDLSSAQDATTAAFARLVLLRRELRRIGRDLRLTGLHDRAARVYEVSRLDSVLPRC